jgi:hypothetical protein
MVLKMKHRICVDTLLLHILQKITVTDIADFSKYLFPHSISGPYKIIII